MYINAIGSPTADATLTTSDHLDWKRLARMRSYGPKDMFAALFTETIPQVVSVDGRHGVAHIER